MLRFLVACLHSKNSVNAKLRTSFGLESDKTTFVAFSFR